MPSGPEIRWSSSWMIRSGGRSGPHATVCAAGRSPRACDASPLLRAPATCRGPAFGSRGACTCRSTRPNSMCSGPCQGSCANLSSGGDDERRQQPVDLLVHGDDRQPLVGTLPASERRTGRARRRRRRASASGPSRCARRARGRCRSAPRARGELDRRAMPPRPRGRRRHARHRAPLRGRAVRVRRDGRAHPHADPKRRLAPARRRIRSACGSPRRRRSAPPRAGTAALSAGAACSA